MDVANERMIRRAKAIVSIDPQPSSCYTDVLALLNPDDPLAIVQN